MKTGECNNNLVGEMATILGGSFLLSYAILLLWFIIVLTAPDWFYGINARWFAISRHEFDLVNYSGMAFLKITNIVFFLCPYLSIKIWLRRKKVND